MRFYHLPLLLIIGAPPVLSACEKEPQAFVSAYFETDEKAPQYTGMGKRLNPSVPDLLFIVSEWTVDSEGRRVQVKTLWLYSIKEKSLRATDINPTDFITLHSLDSTFSRRHIISIRETPHGQLDRSFEYYFGLNRCNTSMGSISAKTASDPLSVSKAFFNCCL